MVEIERQYEYRMTQLFCSFFGTNARTQTTLISIMARQFCNSTQKAARPFLLPTQQPMSMLF